MNRFSRRGQAASDGADGIPRPVSTILFVLQAAALCNAMLLTATIIAPAGAQATTRGDVVVAIAAVLVYSALLVTAHEAAHWIGGRAQGLAGGHISLWSGTWPRPRYTVPAQAALARPRVRLAIYLAGPALDQGAGLAVTLTVACLLRSGDGLSLWPAAFAGHAACLFNLLAFKGSDLGEALHALPARTSLSRRILHWNLALAPASVLTAFALSASAWRYVVWIAAR